MPLRRQLFFGFGIAMCFCTFGCDTDSRERERAGKKKEKEKKTEKQKKRDRKRERNWDRQISCLEGFASPLLDGHFSRTGEETRVDTESQSSGLFLRQVVRVCVGSSREQSAGDN